MLLATIIIAPIILVNQTSVSAKNMSKIKVRTTYKYPKGAILEAFSRVSALVAKYQPKNPFKDNKVMIIINFIVINYLSSFIKIKTEDATIETMQQYNSQVELFIQKSVDNFLITVEADAIEILAKIPKQAKKFVHIGFVFMSTTASDIFIIEKQQNMHKVEQAPLIHLNNTSLNASFFSTQVGFLFILQTIILMINPIIILMFIIQSHECSDLSKQMQQYIPEVKKASILEQNIAAFY
ncbi:hypothetical protein ABPG72_005632 [Tetrahymena utriculariae]